MINNKETSLKQTTHNNNDSLVTNKLNNSEKDDVNFRPEKDENGNFLDYYIERIYGDHYKTMIETLENKIGESLKLLEDKYNLINSKYSNFSLDFQNHLNKYTSKMIKVKRLNIINSESKEQINKDNAAYQKHTEQTVVKELKNVVQFHDKIIYCLCKNYEILSKFLDIYKNYLNERSLSSFCEYNLKDVIDSWLFTKLDFNNVNLFKALKLNKFKEEEADIILKLSKSNALNYDVDFSREKTTVFAKLNEEEKKAFDAKILEHQKMIRNNSQKITKLLLKSLPPPLNIQTLLPPSLRFSSAAELTVQSSNFCEATSETEKLLRNFPEVSILKIKKCGFFTPKILNKHPGKISKLYLEKLNLTDTDFTYIMEECIINKESVRSNLEVLSFAGNKLGRVNFSDLSFNVGDCLSNLSTLDFSNNNIYKFILDPQNFNEDRLKIVNLCNNNLSCSCLDAFDYLLCLQGGNPFLTSGKKCKKYYEKLCRVLKKNKGNFDELTKLNLSHIPKKISHSLFSSLKIDMLILISLTKLDLSFCGLGTKIFFSFLDGNRDLLNLETLNLEGNEIEDEFFSEFISNKYQLVLSSLKVLHLDRNRLSGKGKNLQDIFKFMNDNKNLIKLSITHNPLMSNYYSMTNHKEGNATKKPQFVKREEDGKVTSDIRNLFELIVKIKEEIISQDRPFVNVRFDARSNVNRNSFWHLYDVRPIVPKNYMK